MAPFPSPTSTWHDKTYPALSPSRPELSAKGKSVLITGGGTGIGAETARYFAAAGAARIALLGRREQPLLDTKASIEEKYPDTEVFTASTDVTKQSQVDSAFANFLGKGKKLDVVVSNAAVSGPMGRVDTEDADDILKGVHDNLSGSLYVAQAFLRYAATDAVAVNVSSASSHMDIGGNLASYSIAKMAANRMWNTVASGHPELRIFHLQPGIVDTDMNKKAGGTAAFGFADDANLPASFMVWLASPEARFLKGKFLWSNWDVDELKSRSAKIEASSDFNVGLSGWPFGHDDWKLPVPTDVASWKKAQGEV